MTITNPYKRRDVFRCNMDAHRRFDGWVSAYHVLKEKACFPQGCLYFLWRCVLLEKGERCVHGFNHVGKTCRGCTYYCEEKVNPQPQLMLDDESFAQFQDEVDQFESWLGSVRFKRLDLAGEIINVKPWYTKVLLPREEQTRLRGYLLIIKQGFIGLHAFEDPFYVRVSEKVMRQFDFIPKMRIEMVGEIREDRGRIVVYQPKQIEVIEIGSGRLWTKEAALVSIKTAGLLKDQHEQCLACSWGSLVDVTDKRDRDERRFRRLYCLKNVADPRACYVHALDSVASLSCSSTMIVTD